MHIKFYYNLIVKVLLLYSSFVFKFGLIAFMHKASRVIKWLSDFDVWAIISTSSIVMSPHFVMWLATRPDLRSSLKAGYQMPDSLPNIACITAWTLSKQYHFSKISRLEPFVTVNTFWVFELSRRISLEHWCV